MATGRPRKFDIETVIERAMYVFWKYGYDGTTIDNLTAEMCISRPSLYAAFGSKEKLFSRVLDRYRADPASYVNRAIEEPTANLVFERLLQGVIELTTDPENPGGCLFVCGALAVNETSMLIRNDLATRRIDGELDIAKRFRRAVEEGDLPPDADADALAKLAATMLWGISVQAVNGATKSELQRVARLAIGAFPRSKK